MFEVQLFDMAGEQVIVERADTIAAAVHAAHRREMEGVIHPNDRASFDAQTPETTMRGYALSDADNPMPLRYGETPDAPLMVLWILDRLVAPIGFVRRLDN